MTVSFPTPHSMKSLLDTFPLNTRTAALATLANALPNQIQILATQAQSTDAYGKYKIAFKLLYMQAWLIPQQHLYTEESCVPALLGQMIKTINTALVPTDDQQDDQQHVWGPRLSEGMAYLDSKWEELMNTPPKLPFEPAPFLKRVISTITLIWTQFLSLIGWRHQSDIIRKFGEGVALHLGELPLQTLWSNGLQELKHKQIGAMLSLVEPFENRTLGWISSPVTPEQLVAEKIKQLQLPSLLTMTELEQSVEFIEWNRTQKRSVYVHCIDGNTRGALVCAAYLIKYAVLSVDEACEQVQQFRPSVRFNPETKAWLEVYKRRVLGEEKPSAVNALQDAERGHGGQDGRAAVRNEHQGHSCNR